MTKANEPNAPKTCGSTAAIGYVRSRPVWGTVVATLQFCAAAVDCDRTFHFVGRIYRYPVVMVGKVELRVRDIRVAANFYRLTWQKPAVPTFQLDEQAKGFIGVVRQRMAAEVQLSHLTLG